MAFAGEVRTSLEPGVVSYEKPAYNSEGERNTDSCSDDNRRIPLPVNQHIHSVRDELPGIVETQVREERNDELPASPSGEPGEFDARNLLTEVVLDKDSTSPAENDQGMYPRDRQRLNITSCPNSSSDAASEHGSCRQTKKRRVPAKNRNVRKEATRNLYQATRRASRNTATVENFQGLFNAMREQIDEKLDVQGCILERVVSRMEAIEIKVGKLENTVINQEDKISREIEEVKTEAKAKRDTKKNRSIEHYNNLDKADEMKIANEKTELLMQKLNKIESTLANVLPYSTMLCDDPRSSNFAGEKNVRSSDNDSKSSLLKEDDTPLGDHEKGLIKKNFAQLVNKMKPDEMVVPMFSRGFLTIEEKQKIQHLGTTRERNDRIISEHVYKGSKQAFIGFLEILKLTNQTHLAKLFPDQRVLYNKRYSRVPNKRTEEFFAKTWLRRSSEPHSRDNFWWLEQSEH